ncbi:protein DDB G0276689-like [Aphis craccivora]|uniref:Protein DDB G0276689-like n=1 Tax=Aphis craccivora TaxID=307492 RepID=A0A6G0W9W7_APHCR|nr:protein DDB G0276689-like [Aphis craccivora]
MNKDKEENNFSENESISSEKELNKTKEIGTQVELNKNIEVEKLIEIKEVSETTQEYIKEKYLDNTKGKSLLDTTFRDDLSTRVEPRVLGLRSTPNIVHTKLGPVRRKQRTKMSSVKATIEQVTVIIPVCADAKDLCSITGKALETLQIGLNSVRMKNDEDVLTYTGRVEQLYHNLCNATLASKTPQEARILRQTLKDQAIAIYINGLEMDLQTISRAKNPETLELAMQMARQLEIEFSFNKELRGSESKTNQNGNKNNYGNQNYNGNLWSNNYQGNDPNGQKFGETLVNEKEKINLKGINDKIAKLQ